MAANTSRENTRTSSNIENSIQRSDEMPGDPNCPLCHGLGYLRLELPLHHPEFGKVHVCPCRQNDINAQVRQRLFSLSHLDELRHLTFENFKPRGRIGLWPHQADSLERAFNHAHQFSQTRDGWLLIQGPYGCGKTHLAAAIANHTAENGVPTLFITVPDLLDSLRFTFSDRETSFEERFEQVRKAPLLVMDDFGTQSATPWAQEKLFQILNYRYINRLPLVVTTNLPLEEIEGRIRSRLEDPELVTIARITTPDYRRPIGDFGHPEVSSLDDLHEMTFASFETGKGEGLAADKVKNLEKALRVARQFAERPRGWLVFTGPYGCGKTHLAAAIGNYWKDVGEESPLLVEVSEFLNHLRATFNPKSTISYDQRFDVVLRSDRLILDNLGTEAMTPWVREKLHLLFISRYNAKRPTVITSSKKVDDMDPRIRTRMLDQRLCTIFAITAPAYPGRTVNK